MLGFFAPLCAAGTLSVVFGIIALVQIRRTGQRGRGLAIGGLAVTGAWVAAFVVGLIVAVVTSSVERDPAGDIVDGGRVEVDALRPGDCVQALPEEAVLRLPVVPCAEPHEGEVYALFDVPQDGDWPGEQVIVTEAEDGCLDQLATYSPAAYDDQRVSLYYLHPTRATWRTGDREVICVAYFLDGERTGSLPR